MTTSMTTASEHRLSQMLYAAGHDRDRHPSQVRVALDDDGRARLAEEVSPAEAGLLARDVAHQIIATDDEHADHTIVERRDRLESAFNGGATGVVLAGAVLVLFTGADADTVAWRLAAVMAAGLAVYAVLQRRLGHQEEFAADALAVRLLDHTGLDGRVLMASAITALPYTAWSWIGGAARPGVRLARLRQHA